MGSVRRARVRSGLETPHLVFDIDIQAAAVANLRRIAHTVMVGSHNDFFPHRGLRTDTAGGKPWDLMGSP